MIQNRSHLVKTTLSILLVAVMGISFVSPAIAKEPNYETTKQLFFPCPNTEKGKTWDVKNFGPVGIGITLKGTGSGFIMSINNVEKGSPAAAIGKLKKGQIIESINGKVLKDRDPRMDLGDIITKAEATDGNITLKIKGLGAVVVKIPKMGSYSKTWPINCQKSDRIVRNLADVLAKQKKPGWGSVLFLLSTGEEKDLAVVRKWMSDLKTLGKIQWHIGYHGIGVCEYYLRTGDERMLPIIKEGAESLKKTMYNGGWSGKGSPASFTYSTGSGQMHAAGVHCMTFLMLARMCGVDVDDYMLNRSLKQFYRFAGHGNVPYGDTWPEGGFRDNGKSGGLAVTMAAAARLTPDGETSVYAKARDNSAMKSFYATNWFHSAHTGGGIGEIWHHNAVSLMHDKRPVPYRSYLDTRRWVMDLSRRHDGSIGIAGVTDRYDKSATEADRSWGTLFALTYTLPRKKLQLYGAPKTKWCRTYQLPKRPWGNANDDIFVSPEPGKHESISMEQLKKETVLNGASVAVFEKLGDPKVSDEVLLKYIHHPEFAFRSSAMGKVVAYNRDRLIVPLLKSSDPRIRHAGLMAITGMFKGKSLPDERITREMFKLVEEMVNDANESWWVTISAMKAMQRDKPQTIDKHSERLMTLMKSENWWVSSTATQTLTVLATNPKYYKRILPPFVKMMTEAETCAVLNQVYGFSKQLNSANPKVKKYATELLKEAFESIPGQYKEPSNNMPITSKSTYVRKCMAWPLTKMPGGEMFVKTRPKMTLASKRSGLEKDMYTYSGKFTRNKKMLGKWIKIRGGDVPSLTKWVKDWEKRGCKPFKSVYIFNLLDGGSIKGEVFWKKMGNDFFWSGDMMINKFSTNEARRMTTKTIEGMDFLFVEKGGFGSIESNKGNEVPANWHCGYDSFVKKSSLDSASSKKNKKGKK